MTQPGSQLDYEWPAEHVSLKITSTAPFDMSVAGQNLKSSSVAHEHYEMTYQVPADLVDRVDVALTFHLSPGKRFASSAAVFTNEDSPSRYSAY